MFRPSRQTWFCLALAAASFVFVYAIVRASSKDASVDMQTCQPIDVWARVSRAYDPLGFWVEQTLTLENAYSKDSLEDAIHECEVNHKADPTSQSQCTTRVQKIYDEAQRCLLKAIEMCQREGGKC